MQNNVYANGGFTSCPVCGQPATTAGFSCGYGGLTGCITGSARRPGAIVYQPLINDHEDINEWIKHWRPADLVYSNPTVIQELQAELEYEKLKADIPRLMFSVKSYIDHMATEETGTDYTEAWVQAYCIVGRAMMETEIYDWSSIVAKYREHFKHQYKVVPKVASK